MKIFTAVDLSEGKVVRFVKGDPKSRVVYSNDPVNIAKKWESEGTDGLHVVDLDAALGQGSNAQVVEKIIENVRIPLQVAGGIRSLDHAKRLLHDVDKIVLGTLAYKEPSIFEALVKEHGGDRIVVAIDQIEGNIMIDGWRKPSGMSVRQGIERFQKMGLQYFLLTSVERDGTMLGPDIDLLNEVCRSTNAKIIASGGISRSEDVSKVKETGAYAVILGKALYDGNVSIKDAKEISR